MMENNNHLQGEIDGFWGDLKASKEQLSYEQQNYARKLKNGLGEEIISYLSKPENKSKWNVIKNKFIGLFKQKRED